MIRRLHRRKILARCLYYSGILFVLSALEKRSEKNVPLYLVGHRILPASEQEGSRSAIDRMALRSGHALTDKALERRLRFVKRLRPVGDPSDFERGIPSGRAFYVTFDDGYVDTVNVGGPILEKLGIKAVIFLVQELVRNPCILPWWDAWGSISASQPPSATEVRVYTARCEATKLATRGLLRDRSRCYEIAPEADRLYLSLGEVQRLQGQGLFFFGNHTRTHANLTQLSGVEIAREINHSTGTPDGMRGFLPLLAYPFGFHNETVRTHVARRADILLAFATSNGSPTDRLSLKRVSLNTESFCLFVAECIGVFDALKRLRISLRRRFLRRPPQSRGYYRNIDDKLAMAAFRFRPNS